MRSTITFRSVGLLAAGLGMALLAGCSSYGNESSTLGAGASSMPGSVPASTPIGQVDRPVGGSPRQTAYPPQGGYGPGTVMPGGTVGPSGTQ